MFPHLALATSAEWAAFILPSALLGKRILSCHINERAKRFIRVRAPLGARDSGRTRIYKCLQTRYVIKSGDAQS